MNDDFWDNDFGSSDNDFTDNSEDSLFDGITGDISIDQPTENNEAGGQPKEVPQQIAKYGTKTAALIIIGVLILLAFVLMLFNRMHITKNDKQTTQAQQTQQSQQQQSQQTTQVQQQQTTNSNDLTLLNADNVSLDYSTKLSTTGRVTSKHQYLSKSNHQVIYEIQLEMGVGTDLLPVHFTCTHNVYSSVSVGETLNIEYYVVQQGQDGGYWALDTIQKP